MNRGHFTYSPQCRTFSAFFLLVIVVIFIGYYNRKHTATLITSSYSLLQSMTLLDPCSNPLKIAEDNALTTYGWSKLVEQIPAQALQSYGKRLRKFAFLWKSYEQYLIAQANNNSEDLMDLIGNPASDTAPYPEFPMLHELEKQLFPGQLNPKKFRSLLELKYSFKGRGLVVACGKYHFHYLLHFIKTVRELGSTLPILIAYAGENDLPKNYREYLTNLKMDVGSFDIYDSIVETEMAGWGVKPYALLIAPFAEVILCDADTVWLQKPEILFDDPGYLSHHVLIFRDRSLFSGSRDEKNWMDANVPLPLSKRLQATRMYRAASKHEQESGASVYNKKERLLSIMAGAKLVSPKERMPFYKQFHGDKESFWLGLEIADEAYTDVQPWAGSIGWVSTNANGVTEACGHIGHFDRQGAPLWFNGGIVHDKTRHGDAIGNFTHYAYGGTAETWTFNPYFCTTEGIHPFNATELATLERLKALFHHRNEIDAVFLGHVH